MPGKDERTGRELNQSHSRGPGTGESTLFTFIKIIPVPGFNLYAVDRMKKNRLRIEPNI
jgi:hypothetical protein